MQVFEDLFGDACGQTLESAADGRFVYAKELSYLQQSVLIEEVGGEKEAVVQRECLKGVGYRLAEFAEGGGCGLWLRVGGDRVGVFEW